MNVAVGMTWKNVKFRVTRMVEAKQNGDAKVLAKEAQELIVDLHMLVEALAL